ncbi:MAG: phosphoenolpyruvate carboxykinase (ATP) [Candidatus Cloacimonadales bacterium]|nr:phosphoenolpyruvate carboxykinase (ATP) [Candidatus Cloacimonadota bacterium]MDD3502094.1 phosphoenolpyruvate carboxykinase (ATP) [Candidatus Cloacimonadota bacterium]MDX9978097.1 phosphoenolpyruvate carboxykinase (ATP) [Candidatus Cloacimonadales bacterium]
MSSLDSIRYYENIKDMSRVRAMAETVMNNPKVRKITAAEAYEMAKKQAGVFETDLVIYPPYAEQLGLPKGSKVLNDCHGKIVGRTAKARRFYNKLNQDDKDKVEGDVREALFQMEQYPLIKAEAVLGQDPDLMIKATFVTTESDVMNVFNWLCNFTPIEVFEKEYKNSKEIPVVDIILVAFNEWTCDDPFYNNVGAPQLALVDELNNVIFNFGMRYFGERKKGTLTLGWTSGMRLGMAACHGGIKEIDFTTCAEEKYHELGKRSIAFFGLSGTGKSSHTNSHTNGDTLPKGFKKVVLHDDAFQIDLEEKICRAWEPTLFDKTDSRPIGHSDWDYAISLMNHSIINIDGKNIPVGQDLRQANGRALLERAMLGDVVNRCSFPKALCWLMKDTVLPPILKFTNKHLAIAMGAALITKRNKAENVSAEDLKKLAFEPFANPFRVYDLWKDVEAFLAIADNGADFYSFNSQGLWKKSDTDLEAIKLQTSLTLQTGILLDQLEWEDWDMLPGAMIPTKESVDKILPGFYDKYNTATRENMDEYKELLKSRFQQRIDFLKNTDIATKPEMLEELINALQVKV